MHAVKIRAVIPFLILGLYRVLGNLLCNGYSAHLMQFFLSTYYVLDSCSKTRSKGKESLQVDAGHDELDPEALGPSPASGLDRALQKSGRVGRKGPPSCFMCS